MRFAVTGPKAAVYLHDGRQEPVPAQGEMPVHLSVLRADRLAYRLDQPPRQLDVAELHIEHASFTVFYYADGSPRASRLAEADLRAALSALGFMVPER